MAITDHLLVSDAGYLSQFSEQMDENISVHLNHTLKTVKRNEMHAMHLIGH